MYNFYTNKIVFSIPFSASASETFTYLSSDDSVYGIPNLPLDSDSESINNITFREIDTEGMYYGYWSTANYLYCIYNVVWFSYIDFIDI